MPKKDSAAGSGMAMQPVGSMYLPRNAAAPLPSVPGAHTHDDSLLDGSVFGSEPSYLDVVPLPFQGNSVAGSTHTMTVNNPAFNRDVPL